MLTTIDGYLVIRFPSVAKASTWLGVPASSLYSFIDTGRLYMDLVYIISVSDDAVPASLEASSIDALLAQLSPSPNTNTNTNTNTSPNTNTFTSPSTSTYTYTSTSQGGITSSTTYTSTFPIEHRALGSQTAIAVT
uniref:hypothetical protein n=1 Tax=Spizellomyces sp. 'palustris' TaxID=117820 RepID=UPI0010FBCE07|nr:hypothetical protein [Spizellomyces sp. 'palustris']QCQ69021.1 hypothetical protein [Spizellomyces sp. 'palustris']